MSRPPPYFEENLQLIQTLRSLPATSSANIGLIGYTALEIFEQQNVLFPATPLTYEEVESLLVFGTKRGIYLNGGCATGVASPTDCSTPVITPENSPSNQLFYINTAMAAVNPRNGAYVAVGYAPDPTQVSIGYLPCDFVWGGGVGANPYSYSTQNNIRSAFGTQFGLGGNAGTGTVGATPTFAVCGTCYQ